MEEPLTLQRMGRHDAPLILHAMVAGQFGAIASRLGLVEVATDGHMRLDHSRPLIKEGKW